MAIITKGILGPVSGRVGNLIFYICSNGKNYVRSEPRKSNKPPSLAQVQQRSKFKFAIRFLDKFKDLIRIGFSEEKRMSPHNIALKELLTNGITGKYPNWQIDYPKLVLSKGKTPMLPALEMVFEKRNEVRLKWERFQFAAFDSADNDLVRVVLYNATEGIFVVNEQAFRCDHQCYVQLPNWIKGDEVQVYVTVHSLKGTPSNSQYAGELIVA
jgi:hypothetical protein